MMIILFRTVKHIFFLTDVKIAVTIVINIQTVAEAKMQAYSDFATGLVSTNKTLSVAAYVSCCIAAVSTQVFGKDAQVMRAAVMCEYLPEYRIFTGDLLMKNQIIPFMNASEAFEHIIQLGVTPFEMALMKEEDGSTNFTLSLHGLRKCAARHRDLQDILNHAKWIAESAELYASKQ